MHAYIIQENNLTHRK